LGAKGRVRRRIVKDDRLFSRPVKALDSY